MFLGILTRRVLVVEHVSGDLDMAVSVRHTPVAVLELPNDDFEGWVFVCFLVSFFFYLSDIVSFPCSRLAHSSDIFHFQGREGWNKYLYCTRNWC